MAGLVRMYRAPVVEVRRRAVRPIAPSTPSDARCGPGPALRGLTAPCSYLRPRSKANLQIHDLTNQNERDGQQRGRKNQVVLQFCARK